MINYMDRLTLNLTARRIKETLLLSNEQYGQIEGVFGIAFAVGALGFGWAADRWNVRGLYAFALFAWSVAGFATGFAQTFVGLLVCRFCLGLFEAGNWPCALRTTQRILPARERTLGNSLLQSGAALGAVITPLIVQALAQTESPAWIANLVPGAHGVRPAQLAPLASTPTAGFPGSIAWAGLFMANSSGTWRYPFLAIGAAGTIWVIFWLASVRRPDLALGPVLARASSRAPTSSRDDSLAVLFSSPRFAALVLMVVTINWTWHFFRVWLPLFLGTSYGYSDQEVNYFMVAYYTAADLGSLTAGFATLLLARHGVTVHSSRLVVFFLGACLTGLSVVVAVLSPGPALLGLLLVLAFGGLALFPVYYSFSQELTVRRQGILTGTLGCTTWVTTALMHPLVGRWIDATQNYAAAIALAGVFPALGFTGLVVLWNRGSWRRT
jgi:ACS family hexuronate transporter-like MFS transporter